MHKDKVTPTDDVSWWIKWTGTVMFLAALITRASDISPALDIALSFSQLSDIHNERSRLEFKIAQLNAAHQMFTTVLKQSINIE